jgi:hypothetical protein
MTTNRRRDGDTHESRAGRFFLFRTAQELIHRVFLSEPISGGVDRAS